MPRRFRLRRRKGVRDFFRERLKRWTKIDEKEDMKPEDVDAEGMNKVVSGKW